MLYRITFGPESREIEAASAADAWSAFCSVNTTANRHPNLYKRTIEVASDVVPIAEPDTGSVVVTPPVMEEVASVVVTPDEPAVE